MEILLKTIFAFIVLSMISCKQTKQSDGSLKSAVINNSKFNDSENIVSKNIKDFNGNVILQAIFSIEGNTLASFIPSKKYITIIKIDSLVEENRDSLDYLLNEYSKFLKGLNFDIQRRKLKKINDWCSFYFTFRTLNNLNYDKPIFFEQLIYEMSQTRKLFDKYININIGQDWSSLDVNESILLFYDFCKYLTELPARDQIKIISEYFKQVKVSQLSG